MKRVTIGAPLGKCRLCDNITHWEVCPHCETREIECKGGHRWKYFSSFDGGQHHQDIACEDCGADYIAMKGFD